MCITSRLETFKTLKRPKRNTLRKNNYLIRAGCLAVHLNLKNQGLAVEFYKQRETQQTAMNRNAYVHESPYRIGPLHRGSSAVLSWERAVLTSNFRFNIFFLI